MNDKIKNRSGRALVMSLTDHSSDPRPRRFTQFLLEKGFEVEVISYPFAKEYDADISDFHYLNKPTFDFMSKVIRRLKRYSPFINRILPVDEIRESLISWRFGLGHLSEKLQNIDYDLIVVEDIYMLPLAFKIGKNPQVIFDAREYYPSQNEESLFFRLFEKPERIWLCRKYLNRCQRLITTSIGFKNEYDKMFNTDFELLRSVPNYVDLMPNDVDKNKIKMVHHGAANRNRQIEKMIEVTQKLDARFSLDLYLTGEIPYIAELKELAKKDTRVRVMDPVNFEDIIPTVNQYDIGLFYCEPTTFNLKHCLPNKLFEFIQGRLMIALGPSPDMAEFVNQYQCGVVSKEFSVDSMAEALSGLSSETVNSYKKVSDSISSKYSFENEKKKLDELLNEWFVDERKKN